MIKFNENSTIELTETELERYDRQLIIKGWGIERQKRLKKSRVAIFGVGGLGSPTAIYLAVAGVGELILVDNDAVELNNLNRQILHWDQDIGRSKVKSAKEKLRKINPHIKIRTIKEKITEDNVIDVIRGVHVVIDALDNFKTRYIVNEACVKLNIPFVHAGVYGFTGQLTTIVPGRGPCLKCIFPKPPMELEKFPIVGVTPGIIGSMEALEAIKLITGIGIPLIGRLFIFDGEDFTVEVVKVKRDEKCPICGRR